jgi:hypothetical protein
VPTVLISGGLNLLETSGPVQACNGIALHFYKFREQIGNKSLEGRAGPGNTEGKDHRIMSHKAQRGSRGTDPIILNLITEGGGGSTPGLGRSIPDKEPRYPT